MRQAVVGAELEAGLTVGENTRKEGKRRDSDRIKQAEKRV